MGEVRYIESDDGDGWYARSPEFRYVSGFGETKEAARVSLESAIKDWFAMSEEERQVLIRYNELLIEVYQEPLTETLIADVDYSYLSQFSQ